MIRPAQDPRFGDYQANCAMSLGKQLGQPPREVAQQIVQRLQIDDLCLPPEVAGPGFINLRLRDDWLAQQLQQSCRDERLGVPQRMRREPTWSTTPPPTWPSRCTWATSARPSSAMRSAAPCGFSGTG